MKKNPKKILTVAACAAIIITIVSSIIGCFAMFSHFDHNLFYFESGSAMAALYMYLPMAGILAVLICMILIHRKLKFVSAPGVNVPTVFASVLSGLLIILSSIFALTGTEPLSGIPLGAAIAGIICGIYLVLLSFMGDREFMTILSIAPVVWAALTLLQEYFRTGEPINSPIKTINLTMISFILLFFAEEIRFGIGKQIPSTYYFCSLGAVVFTGNAVLPKLVVIIGGGSGFNFGIMEWCMYAALFIFILARLSALPAVLKSTEDNANNADTPDSL